MGRCQAAGRGGGEAHTGPPGPSSEPAGQQERGGQQRGAGGGGRRRVVVVHGAGLLVCNTTRESLYHLVNYLRYRYRYYLDQYFFLSILSSNILMLLPFFPISSSSSLSLSPSPTSLSLSSSPTSSSQPSPRRFPSGFLDQ